MKVVCAVRNRLGSVAFSVLVALTIVMGSGTLLSQTVFPGKIGVEVSDRPNAFVDVWTEGRLFGAINGVATFPTIRMVGPNQTATQ